MSGGIGMWRISPTVFIIILAMCWWWWWWRCDGINADYPYFLRGCFSGPPTHNNMNNKSCSERVVFVSAMMMMMMFGSVFSFEQYLVCYLSSLIFVAVVFVVLLHSLVRRICPIDGAPHLPPHPPPSPLTSPATAAASPADFSLPPPPLCPPADLPSAPYLHHSAFYF